MQRGAEIVIRNNMNMPPAPLNPPASAPELARRVAAILAGLAAVVARRFLREPKLIGLIIPLWVWLGRAARRLERAMTRLRAIRAVPVATAQVARVGRVRPVRLPSGQAWLVRALGWEAAGYGCQLEALLAEPEMQAVLARLPAAGRILRPLCRMLGMTVPALVARAKPLRKKRVRLPVWPARKARRPLLDFTRRGPAIVFND